MGAVRAKAKGLRRARISGGGFDVGWVMVKAQEVALSEALHHWFGASAVVDDAGKRLIVYHGTADDFSVFDKTKRGSVSDSSDSKLGFFFSSNVERANRAAEDAGYPGGENVMPVYLSIQNPLIYNGAQGLPSETAKIIRKAIRQGCDGVIFRLGECGGQDYVVFEPEQIKSAISLNGQVHMGSQDICHFGTPIEIDSVTRLRETVREGIHSGRVVSIEGGIMTQRVNREGKTKLHDLRALSMPVEVGQVVDIKYVGGEGQVGGQAVDKGVGR